VLEPQAGRCIAAPSRKDKETRDWT
jgi:hypothetical protein